MRALGLRRLAINGKDRVEFRARAPDIELAALHAQSHHLKPQIVFEGNPHGFFEGQRPALSDRRRADVVARIEDLANGIEIEFGDGTHLNPVRRQRVGPGIRREQANQRPKDANTRCSAGTPTPHLPPVFLPFAPSGGPVFGGSAARASPRHCRAQTTTEFPDALTQPEHPVSNP